MLTAEERQRSIALVRELPDKLEAALAGLDDRQMGVPEREGEWSVRAGVHHMADADANFFVRMKLVVTTEKPPILLFPQEEWAALPDTTEVGVRPSVMMLRGIHERWAKFLETLPEAAWVRQAVRPDSGEVTLDSLLAYYANHGEVHLDQIAKVRRAQGW